MPSNKTQKNPRLNFRAINFSRGTTQPGYVGTIMNLQIVLNTPKFPLQIKLPQKASQIFLPTKIVKWKISNPKKSFDHPCVQVFCLTLY